MNEDQASMAVPWTGSRRRVGSSLPTRTDWSSRTTRCGSTVTASPRILEPWKQIGVPGGNDFEVNFIPDYKHLREPDSSWDKIAQVGTTWLAADA
jgi:hypothetical protein